MSVDKLREALDIFGPVMVQAYGQAEAPFFMCTVLSAGEHAGILRDPALRHRLASCGRASPFVRLGIMDPHGNLLPAGERGEIVVQGDLVAQGYYQDPRQDRRDIQAGWLHTGDVGYQDGDGYLYIVDRMKDLIVSPADSIFLPARSSKCCGPIRRSAIAPWSACPTTTGAKPSRQSWSSRRARNGTRERVLAYCRERLEQLMKTPRPSK